MKKYGLISLGVTELMDPEFRRVTMLSNVVYLLIFGIVALFLVLNIPHYLEASPPPQEYSVPVSLLTVSVTCLLLNRAHRRGLSKLLFLLAWIFFTMVFVPLQRGTTESAFVSVGLYAVISSVMVHLLFSWRRERTVYAAMVALTWTIILFFVEFLELFRVPGDHNVLYQPGFPRWRLMVVFLGLFFNGAVIYMVRVNNELTASLLRRNQTIEDQNRQLADQREKLVALTMQLRQKVDDTHEQLTEQTTRLDEYTYFNSHILRAPVSRIRGLIHLLTLKLNTAEEQEVRDLLARSMEELDEAIKKISERLN